MSIHINIRAGSHTHSNSENITSENHAENMRDRLSGDTSITWMGAKYRVAEKGEKNAMPRPPLVKASSMPCEAAARKMKLNVRIKLAQK